MPDSGCKSGHTVNARAVVLSFIRAYMAAHDDSPSLGEIADGVRSTKPAVARVMAGLERDGELIRLPAPPRTKRRIVLPEQHVRALTLLRALGYKINGALVPKRLPADAAHHSLDFSTTGLEVRRVEGLESRFAITDA